MSAVSDFGAAKRAVSEVGSGSRFPDSWRSRTAKKTSDGARLDVTAEVDRGGGVVHLVPLYVRIASL